MAHRIPSVALLLALAGAGPALAQYEVTCLGTAGSTQCTSLIPDAAGGVAGVLTSTIPVPAGTCASPTAGRVVIGVDLEHNHVGDLTLRVRNPSGTWVALLDQPQASPPQPGGCPNDDIVGLFADDGAAFPCSFTIPAGSGFLAPQPSLTLFNGVAAGGTWTLEITDHAASGIGALDDWSVDVVCGTPPIVSITATDPIASEQPLETGAFTVSRSIASSSPLVVNLTIGGTAGPAHYAPITVPVTIPALATSVTVTVSPIADAIAENAPTVEAGVGPGMFYTVGSSSFATVEILDLVENNVAVPALSVAGLALLALLLLAAGLWLLRGRLG